MVYVATTGQSENVLGFSTTDGSKAWVMETGAIVTSTESRLLIN